MLADSLYKMMGGSNSGVSVGHGERAGSYKRRRRDVLAGGPGVLPQKFLKSQGRIVAFGGVCGNI